MLSIIIKKVLNNNKKNIMINNNKIKKMKLLKLIFKKIRQNQTTKKIMNKIKYHLINVNLQYKIIIYSQLKILIKINHIKILMQQIMNQK